jgi:hypothetical protein
MLEVADIFRRYGGAYLEAFGESMLPSHRRAIRDILHCRTEALGGHVFRCDHCGHEQYAYHSCRNRHCPQCHRNDSETWLEKRRREILPVAYFHIVFTLPQPLHEIVRRHQKKLYGLLMKAAAKALIKVAADPHYVGGLIGVLAVLHTWSRTLGYHPHVHCLVPAGGLSPDRTHWLPARQSYFAPVKAISKLFRGIFRDLLRKQLPDVQLPASVWRKKWVVYCKPAVHGTDAVLTYLARYVHRVAITNSRILSIDAGNVTFQYNDSRDNRRKTLTLTATEFIRRFLQHVLPAGFHKVRYYGLWSPSNRHRLLALRLQLALDQPQLTDLDTLCEDECREPPAKAPKCPCCGIGTLICVGTVLPQTRSPP